MSGTTMDTAAVKFDEPGGRASAAAQLERTSGVQVRMALTCILLTVFGGAMSALYYIPSVAIALNDMGVQMTAMRPIHTAFASMWIFGASVAIAYHWMGTHHDGLSAADVLRFRIHTACWIVAGVGIFVTLLMGISTGREYLGFHPVFSAILLFGWLCFAFNLLKRLKHGFWGQPIYVWFWTVGTLYFIYTFVEGHAYLLPGVFESPIRDLQVQWKSCGTLVGSFNFLMYGSLTYVGEKMSGDKRYAQSPVAFWLFGVGCLNSFTNYVHHTYHLPQTETVKWVAFIVSMMEVIILVKLMLDLGKLLANRKADAPFCGRGGWLTQAKYWTVAMLFTSIVISVPTFNTLIHGTQLVMGHAMGATVGIDTLVLLGTSSWLVHELRGGAIRARLDAQITKVSLLLVSLSLAVLVTWLSVAGFAHGASRYYGEPTPEWVATSRLLLPVVGAALGVGLVIATWRLLSMSRRGAGAS